MNVKIDDLRGLVCWDGGSARLAPGEISLMHALLSGPQTRESLVDAIHPDGGNSHSLRIVTVRMSQLRRKLIAAGFPGTIGKRYQKPYYLDLGAAP